jgi:hypothetical protein
MNSIGKMFIIIGLVVVALGVLLTILSKFNIPLGRLPGDIFIKRDNFSFYFPLTTSIIVSIILSLIFYLISRR